KSRQPAIVTAWPFAQLRFARRKTATRKFLSMAGGVTARQWVRARQCHRVRTHCPNRRIRTHNSGGCLANTPERPELMMARHCAVDFLRGAAQVEMRRGPG